MENTDEAPVRTTPLPLTHGISDEEYLKLLTFEEKEALAEYKKYPITDGFSDRRLMIYLFARKLKPDRAVTLLSNNLEFRQKHDIPYNITREQVSDKIYHAHSTFIIPGATDKQGHAIHYLVPGRLFPSDYSVRDFFLFMLYLSDASQWEYPEYHRKGIIVVEDLTDCSMKNFDNRLMKKEKGKKKSPMEDIFPGRIPAIYLLNAPMIIKPLLAVAKFFLKAKLVQRIQIVKKEALLGVIDKSQLHEHFGGDLAHVDI